MKNAINVTRLLCLLSTTTLFYTSCDKDEKDQPAKKVIPVTNIQVSSKIDLSARSEWSFFLGDKEYVYQINNSAITATPKNQPFNIPYKEDNSGNIIPIKEGDGLQVRLFAKGYYYGTVCGDCPPKPNTKDQTTLEKFRQADILYGIFTGVPSPELTGIKLVHQSALLDFSVQDLPADAQVTVFGQEPTQPFADADNHYKAIVLSRTNGPALVRIQTADTTYGLEVRNENGDRVVTTDKHYTFTIKYDQQTKHAAIQNLSITTWSEE